MSTMSSRRQRAQSPTEWARARAHDPVHRDEIHALMTEIDVRQDLIALREARGLTQVELAEKLGVRQPIISKLEGGGTKDLKLSTLVKVAAALGARVKIMFEPQDRQMKAAVRKATADGRKRKRAAA